ncbi:PREDICTED: fibrillin-1-like isoform X1 [Acropora digitifera]|uniref:fibrillin-1-like isoform X1 n=1 Tax=Acropora digitifera TaxID=70779 RepID=UPI00077A3E8B|nr:PREDICTED: fibrillin-1-like isoform X1 [Acropora digitifera]
MVHVVWSALSVGFLALYLAFSIKQASSNGVEDTDACESFQPIYGGAFLHHVYQTLKLPGSIYCLRACDDDIRCQSINHVVHGEICELNNRTKEARPEAFTTDDTKVYMRKFRKRTAIGSISQVPAESCNEIKTSEKGRNGKYWLSSIIPGKPLFAYCDMNTGDADECTASPPVCHVSSLCNNTIGSYSCTCNPGYTGDGKTCTDVNECTESTHNCSTHFFCVNTPGSFGCAYNYSRESCQGIREDGKQRGIGLGDGPYSISTNSSSFYVSAMSDKNKFQFSIGISDEDMSILNQSA